MRPSSALAGADAIGAPDRSAPNGRDATRALIGRLTHALLQHLPGCPPERRRDAAERFLKRRGPSLEEAMRREIAGAAIALIEDPRHSDLFGPQSAAEVDVVAALDKGLVVSGRIDRLAETKEEVLIADFKTGQPRAALDAIQLRQLALYRAALAPLYPQKRLRCFIVWTRNALAVEAGTGALDDALALALGGAALAKP
jgi:ATP-dependent helicase/nuclease subunit A